MRSPSYQRRGAAVPPSSSSVWYWTPLLATPFIEPNIYANALARDLYVLAAALFAAAATMQHPHPITHPPNRYSWLFLLLCLLPALLLLATESAQAPWYVWRQTLYLTAVWMLFAMMRTESHLLFASREWTLLFTITAYLYLLYAITLAWQLQWFDNGESWHFWAERSAHFPGPLQQQNQQALFLVITTTLIWRESLRSNQQRYWEIVSLLPIAGIFLTASRSGAIVLLLAALLTCHFSRWQPHSALMLLRTAIAGSLLSIAILAITPNQTDGGVIDHIQSELTDSAPSIRMMVWQISLQLWLQHPWLGVGWGNLPAHLYDTAATVMATHPEFTTIANHLSGGVTQAHNIILQFLVEGGVTAAAALLLLAIALGRRLQQWYHSPPTIASGAVTGAICAIVILAHGMVSVTTMEPLFMVLLALSLAACFADDTAR
ncbi:MAG: O-antigen ligase family protein [Mariprofundales bacterium]|nr:O-antigen ligase family protein [Mariprofundales bacterium]